MSGKKFLTSQILPPVEDGLELGTGGVATRAAAVKFHDLERPQHDAEVRELFNVGGALVGEHQGLARSMDPKRENNTKPMKTKINTIRLRTKINTIRLKQKSTPSD